MLTRLLACASPMPPGQSRIYHAPCKTLQQDPSLPCAILRQDHVFLEPPQPARGRFPRSIPRLLLDPTPGPWLLCWAAPCSWGFPPALPSTEVARWKETENTQCCSFPADSKVQPRGSSAAAELFLMIGKKKISFSLLSFAGAV